MADIYDLVREMLAKPTVGELATISPENEPWVVPVGLSFDQSVLSWQSFEDTRHSQYVEKNPQVAFNVLTDDGQKAVYGRATVMRTHPGEGGRTKFVADITEIWYVPDEKVNGVFIPRQELDPEKL